MPLTADYPLAKRIQPNIVTHTFGAGNAKREQRFYLGDGANHWSVQAECTIDEWNALKDFWELRKGGYQPFTFTAYLEDGSTSNLTVHFDENDPLEIEWITQHIGKVTVNLVEVNTGDGPIYPLHDTVERFPNSSLADALLEQAQTIIPLVHIRPRKAGYPNNIFLSDRRCEVSGILYQARLLRWEGIGQTAVGVPGSGSSGAESDDVTLVFGNADRVMRDLAADVRLDLAWVEFSLYHVETGIKLNLWAGEIVPGGWRNNAGPEFVIKCSDPVASPYLTAPDRIIDRKCDAFYDGPFECPFTSQGAIDVTHFPLVDAGSCDRGYDTPNGCLAHGMERYYRGLVATPQGVRITVGKGWFNTGGQAITSLSLVSDSVYGKALAQIYTDIPMPVQASIILGRDEDEFYEAVGVVGVGPLTSFGTLNKLDGQFSHTYPASNGRLVLGTLPAGENDFLSLDYNGNQTAGDWRKAYVGNSTFLRNYSAEVAFASVRRTDEKGLQLTRLEDHSMEVIVNAGLKGYAWTDENDPESRVELAPNTNPVWVAVNLYLRTIGLRGADATTQAAKLHLPSIIAAAAICDIRVDRLIGDTEASNGTLASVAPDSAGSAYNVGELVSIGGGDGNATAIIDGVGPSGEVVSLAVNEPGTGYSSASGVSASGGSGSGLSLIVTATELDDGKETQFKFIGTIQDVRPLRDWLNDILQNCLGYYYFNFGKLAIGIRENSSAIAAFTDGSVLWKSVKTADPGTQFNRLTCSFSDPMQDPATGLNQFVTNTATFQDDDHAKELGGGVRAIYRNAQMNLVGTANISQAQRIANTRGREEVGGVNATQRNAAVGVSWQSTIMALDVAVGDVTSITDDEIPGGSGENRCGKWVLNGDYSVSFLGRSTTDDMYDLVAGPKPADVTPGAVPPEFFPQPLRPRWFPNEIAPDSDDAVYDENDLSFDIAQEYKPLADSSINASLTVTGKLPVDQFIADMITPIIHSQSQNSLGTGGLETGKSYWACICFRNADGAFSPPSNIRHFHFVDNGADDGELTLSDIEWPPGSDEPGSYVLFVGDSESTMCAQVEVSDTGGLPDSITFSGPRKIGTYNCPSPIYSKIRLKSKRLVHGGVLGLPIDSIKGNRTIVAGQAVDVAGIDDWTGRKLMFIGRDEGSCPFKAFNCTSFDPATGEFGVDRDLTDIHPGDVFVVCMQGYDNSATPNVFSDQGLSNAANYELATRTPTPHSGLTPDLEKGCLIMVIAGLGRGEPPARVIANGPTSYLTEQPLIIDSTSIWIVVDPVWEYASETSPISNGDATKEIALTFPTADFLKESRLVGGFIVNSRGTESLEDDAPVRMIYLFGAGLRVIYVNSDTDLGPYDQVVNADATDGSLLLTLADTALWIGRRVVVKIFGGDNAVTVQTATINGIQQTVDGQTSWTIQGVGSYVELVGNF